MCDQQAKTVETLEWNASNSYTRMADCFVKPSQDFILYLWSTLYQFTKHTNRQHVAGKTAKRIKQFAIC
jgi:hypothetical protein